MPGITVKWPRTRLILERATGLGVNCLTIASQIEGAGSGGFLTPPRRDNRRAFRAAMRHSRLVRFTRVGLPLVIVLCVAAFGTYRWFDPMRALSRLPISTDGMVISGTKIVMRQPRLTGYTKDERPYTVTARTAAKDLTNPDALELRGHPHDDRACRTAATWSSPRREGFYDGKAETLRLQKSVVVSSPEYEVQLRDALVHVRAGNVVSDNPVEVKMLQGTINANRLEVAESGAVIRFERGVTLVFDREDSAPRATRRKTSRERSGESRRLPASSGSAAGRDARGRDAGGRGAGRRAGGANIVRPVQGAPAKTR